MQPIDDARSTAGPGWIPYSFTYNADAIPHLTGIKNNIATGESYPLHYKASQALIDPFARAQNGSAVRLQSPVVHGLNLMRSFECDGDGRRVQKVAGSLVCDGAEAAKRRFSSGFRSSYVGRW